MSRIISKKDFKGHPRFLQLLNGLEELHHKKRVTTQAIKRHKNIGMIKEIEVKIQLNRGEKIANRLKKLGALRVRPKYTQTTYGFFSENSIEKGIFPRIRIEDKKPVLTIKIKNIKQRKINYFERKEYKYPLRSIKSGLEMLKLLGYSKIRKFTKQREEWFYPLRNVNICIDKLYFGRFIEIEGRKDQIEKTIRDLNLEDRERITKAYLAIEDDILSDAIFRVRKKI